MYSKDASQFWLRYQRFVTKDLPILLKTNISQSTLSTWKQKKIFPRADIAFLIANAIDTTVEYLVTGQDTSNIVCSSDSLEVAIIADNLTEEGLHILKCVATSLESKYSKKKK
jgi:transcriptional regulator with XRE-family HTH domain